LIKNFKKAQLAAAQKGHSNQQMSAQKTESEKLREQIKQLQYEIIKRKQAEVRLEEKVAELTTSKDELQRELAELKQTAQPDELHEEVEPTSQEQLQPEIPENKKDEQQVAQEPATDEKEQPVISESVQAGQDIGEESAEVSAKDKHVEKKPPKRGKTYEDLHRVVDEVKQKLCRKCNEWKPESGFHKNASSKDGLAGSCKACKTEAAKKYRKPRKTAQD
jgi:chromosome segregation ATPase